MRLRYKISKFIQERINDIIRGLDNLTYFIEKIRNRFADYWINEWIRINITERKK